MSCFKLRPSCVAISVCTPPIAGYIAASNPPVCFRPSSTKMESKGNKNSLVLMLSLSFNLILTLGLIGFTCYSLYRLDSRLTAVEQNVLLTNLHYELANRVIVQPNSSYPHPSRSQVKRNVVKRAANTPSVCSKCCRFCNGTPNVSFQLIIGFIPLHIYLLKLSNVSFS